MTVPSRVDDLLSSYTMYQAALDRNPSCMVEVLEAFLDNISQGASLNAFVRVYAQEARERAAQLMAARQRGAQAALSGMVVSIKDLFCYRDHPVQASSRILEHFVSQISATAVTRLLDAGAIIAGHVNCDEFGMGSSNEHSVYGAVHNPIDPTRSAGGSSGGSAASVRAHMCHVSLGTDTGGSVRQPAAFCGLVGLKPTYGRISRYGVIAYSSSLDTVGILAHNVADCAHTLHVIAGKDDQDMTSSCLPVPDYTTLLDTRPTGLKIGYLQDTLVHTGVQQEIVARTRDLLSRLQQDGHQVCPVAFPLLDYVLPTYYILTTGEASTELSRYDGVRYGYRASGAQSFQEMVRQTRTQGFGKEVKRRLMVGAFVLTSDYYDSYYGQAQRVRQQITTAMEAMLQQYDFIVCPTTPTTAFELNSSAHDPVAQYLADLFTAPASVAGLPAISVPNGVDEAGLPIGVQLIAAPFQEPKLLQFANYIAALQN